MDNAFQTITNGDDSVENFLFCLPSWHWSDLFFSIHADVYKDYSISIIIVRLEKQNLHKDLINEENRKKQKERLKIMYCHHSHEGKNKRKNFNGSFAHIVSNSLASFEFFSNCLSVLSTEWKIFFFPWIMFEENERSAKVCACSCFVYLNNNEKLQRKN